MLLVTRTLTLRDASQTFARCIWEVEAGEYIIIERNGTPVARLSPINRHRVLTPVQKAAWEKLKAATDIGRDIAAGPLDRDALHEG